MTSKLYFNKRGVRGQEGANMVRARLNHNIKPHALLVFSRAIAGLL